ncbi:MAG TPA: DUF1326 domain-containing protein [Verrucomicrobiae bacterium]|nr:DUF1326 domain-containing protein [Verrucomicrobiae bacterium]
MKSFLIPVILCLGLVSLHATDAPRGTVLELHSCELYAGGCTVSAEATQAGRYLLRAWDFTSGKSEGVALKGLKVAVLQSSTENQAAAGARTGKAVVYLPKSASAKQRKALLAWVQARPDFKPESVSTRTEPLSFDRDGTGYRLVVGKRVALQTKPLEACDARSCGEELWYEPRTQTDVFTVAVNRASNVSEPLLQLTWKDSAQRSVFLGRFGESSPRRDLFVSMNEFCGTSL